MTNEAQATDFRIVCHVRWSRTNLEIERQYTLKGRYAGQWATALKDTTLESLREWLPSRGVSFDAVPIKTINHRY